MRRALQSGLPILLAASFLRCWLAVAVPLDGDEVYYAAWGLTPKLMYTDHPPLMGWVYALLHALWPTAVSTFSIRLPWLISMMVMGLLLLKLQRRFRQSTPAGTLLFQTHLLTYIPIFRADHLVVLWTLSAVYLWWLKPRSQKFLVPIALIPLTKYLGVLALPPWLRALPRKRWMTLGLTAMGALGYILVTNALTDWRNLRFSFGDRFAGHLSSLYGGGIGSFLLALGLGAGPIALSAWDRNLWKKPDSPGALLSQCAATYCLFLGIFALATARFQSAWIVPGVLLFLCGQSLHPTELPSWLFKMTVGIQSVLTVTAILGVLSFQLGFWNSKLDPTRERAYLIALYNKPRAFTQWLEAQTQGTRLMTQGIAEAALLRVFGKDPSVAVLPTGYHWFRDLQDSQNIDAYTGTPVTYLALGSSVPAPLHKYCPSGWKLEHTLFERYPVPLARCARFEQVSKI